MDRRIVEAWGVGVRIISKDSFANFERFYGNAACRGRLEIMNDALYNLGFPGGVFISCRNEFR